MKLKELNLKCFMIVYDATSFYLSARYDDRSVYPKIETGYAFTLDMKDENVEKLNNQTFTQRSALLKLNVTVHLLLFINI